MLFKEFFPFIIGDLANFKDFDGDVSLGEFYNVPVTPSTNLETQASVSLG
jgi:hypothetical protein